MSVLLTLICFLFSGISSGKTDNTELSLEKYRKSLEAFRLEFGGSRDMPDIKLFLFGMGNRTKYIYKEGKLRKKFIPSYMACFRNFFIPFED